YAGQISGRAVPGISATGAGGSCEAALAAISNPTLAATTRMRMTSPRKRPLRIAALVALSFVVGKVAAKNCGCPAAAVERLRTIEPEAPGQRRRSAGLRRAAEERDLISRNAAD